MVSLARSFILGGCHKVNFLRNAQPSLVANCFRRCHTSEDHELSPIIKKPVTIEDMFNARVHYGHKVGTLKDDMKWAMFGERLGVCIFDLDITKKYMIRALNFLAHAASHGSIILFVTTNKSQMLSLEKTASDLNEYSHTRQWRDGTFTGGRRYFKASIRLPDVVILMSTLTSTLEQHPALVECSKMAIPTIAIVDSNAECSYVTYPIPGNDDSMASFNYYMQMFKIAIESGKEYRRKLDKEDVAEHERQKDLEEQRKEESTAAIENK